MIPTETAREISSRVLAEFGEDASVEVLATVIIGARRNATGLGGDIVESRDFQFPIDVCHTCLASCAECAEGQCPVEGFANGWFGGVCGNAQDIPVFPLACAGDA